jgi:hypothetical protein
MTYARSSLHSTGRRPLLASARAAFAVLTFVAIGRQLLIHIGEGYLVLNFFSYFTNLANLFAAGVMLMAAWDAWAANVATHVLVRAMSVVNMAIVGIVFSVLLRNVDLGSLLPWVNFVVHYLMPCAVVVDWLVQPPASRLGMRQLGLILLFPLLYLAYVLARGAAIGWYPYPFLDPVHVGGYAGVAGYALGISVTFLAAGGLLFAFANRRAASLH